MKQIVTAVAEALGPPLRRYGRMSAEERIEHAAAINDVLLEAQATVAATRRAAVRELRTSGWTLQEIADLFGLTVSRVHQIEHGYSRAERKYRKEG